MRNDDGGDDVGWTRGVGCTQEGGAACDVISGYI